jgi:hypothetical protein
MRKTHLTTVEEVLDVLGTTAEINALSEREAPQTVSNWRIRQKLPADLYARHTARLASLGFSADPEIWGQLKPLPSDAAAIGASAHLPSS